MSADSEPPAAAPPDDVEENEPQEEAVGSDAAEAPTAEGDKHDAKVIEAAALRIQTIYRGRKAREIRTARTGRIPDAGEYDGSQAVDPKLLKVAMEGDDEGETEYPSDAYTAVKVLTGTWNLGHCVPPPALDQWLPVDDVRPDVVVVALQSCDSTKPLHSTRSGRALRSGSESQRSTGSNGSEASPAVESGGAVKAEAVRIGAAEGMGEAGDSSAEAAAPATANGGEGDGDDKGPDDDGAGALAYDTSEAGGDGAGTEGGSKPQANGPSSPHTATSPVKPPRSGLRTQQSSVTISEVEEEGSTDEEEKEEAQANMSSLHLNRLASFSRDPLGSPRGSRTPKTPLRVERRRSATMLSARQRQSSPAQQEAAKAAGSRALATVQSHLGSDYKRIEMVQLHELVLAVWVHEDHEGDSLKIRTDTEEVGSGGLAGKKGGVAIKFEFYETSLCFIACHLPPHEDEAGVAARNSNLKTIFEGLDLGIQNVDPGSQFDHCFLLGDLNYRLDLGILDGKERPAQEHAAEIVRMVENGHWFKLYQADQLRREMRQGHALRGFQEGILRHPPTFKVIRAPGFSYNSARRPAWTDRVLWRSAPAVKDLIKHHWVQAGPRFPQSDHKPVSALFTVTVPPPAIPYASRVKGPIVAIFAIEGENLLAMDPTGASDPYIQFHGVPDTLLRSTISHTRTRVATLNPTWFHESRPLVLQLYPYPIKDLRRFSLMFHIQDWDLLEDDDNMGCALVSMEDLLGSSPDDLCELEVPVLYGGLPGGTLRAVMCIVEPDHALYDTIRKRHKLNEEEPSALGMCGGRVPGPLKALRKRAMRKRRARARGDDPDSDDEGEFCSVV